MNCWRCKKQPAEIAEYVDIAREEETTPEKYVRDNEGTFNPGTGHFYCTECYIEAGMPLGVAP